VIYQNGEYFVSCTQYGVSDLANEVEVDVCKDSGYLATPYCKNHGTEKLKPTDAHSKYYCPLHNKDVSKYPIAPGETLNKDFKTDEEIKAEEEKKKQEEEERKKQEEEQRRQQEEQQRQQEEQQQQQQQDQTEPAVVPDPQNEEGTTP
jgi:serine phosphatase RsbU (regulator of sigma subunit)